MSPVEFIGFVITFAAMILLFSRKAKEEKRRRMDPEGYEREQRAKKEALEKMYGVLMDGHPPKPPPQEEEYYEEEVVALPPLPEEPPKSASIPLHTNKRIPKKEMVVLSTIFGPPKGLRKG